MYRVCLVVGIAGGTCSGKTTLARRIIAQVGPERVCYLPQDAYYRDLSHLAVAQRALHNYDEPSCVDLALLALHVEALKHGRTVRRPIYDFVSHTRQPGAVLIRPAELLLVEGTLILASEAVRNSLDLRVFLDLREEEQLARRLRRDVRERGREPGAVVDQYTRSVGPMYRQFVGPSAKFADLRVVADEEGLTAACEVIVRTLKPQEPSVVRHR